MMASIAPRRDNAETRGDRNAVDAARGQVRTLEVTDEEAELRLDRWFRRRFPLLPHGRLEKLLRTGQVRVDGRRARAGDRLAPGQAIRVPPLDGAAGSASAAPLAAQSRPQPRPRDVEAVLGAILHRDDDLIAINKPPGLAVQGGTNTERHIDGLLDELRFGAKERPRLVHRLDKDTSGVLLLARSAAAAAKLTAAFREKTTRKTYWAVIVGSPRPRQGRIDLALAKGAAGHGERVQPDEDEGKRAVTYYRVIENAGAKAAWVALLPVTGRTHQLRVHCAATGVPILGDGKYGGAKAHLAGAPNARLLHLHARALAVPHPRGGIFRVEAPLPPHMRETWDFFGFSADIEEDPFAELEP
jgi:23S rRNA pseudouridine955/2504/2580 synthase